MNAAEIVQIGIILAPIVKDIAVEGGKIVATFRDNLSQEDLNKSLELSKSSTWDNLDFGLK